MDLKGKISKINSELGYGFVTVKGLGEIFFSEDTSFKNAEFKDLKIGQLVTIIATETPRGMFASSFILNSNSASESTTI